MSISYEYYKIFYYVARYHSFNKAAKVLLNSQPNISRAINNLESDLGCSLFSRSNRGVELTRQGEILFEYVSEAHRLLSDGEVAIHDMTQTDSQFITIGLSTDITDFTTGNRILPPIRKFSHQNPDTRLRFINDSSLNLSDRVDNGELDMAIITTNENSETYPQATILYTFEEIPIGGNEFKDRLYGRRVSIKELSDYPIITLTRDTETFAIHDQLFAKHGLLLKPSIEAHTMRQTLAFVQSDMGLASLAEEYARPAIEEGSVFRIDMIEPMSKRQVALIKNNQSRTRASLELENTIISFNKK